MPPPPPPHHRIAIVGAGFGGLGAAIRLLQEGETDLVVFEKADAVGGVWEANTYPGAACDVQAHLYAFSFAPNADWSRKYAPQPEIRAYLEAITERFGVRPHIRFGHAVEACVWDEDAARWRIETDRGLFTASVLIAAPGALAAPKRPAIPGLDAFPGEVMHTSRWDASVDLAGRRVAVVGTGASAIQVIPALQPEVGHLTVFQRTPAWVIPRRDGPFSERARRRFNRRPAVQRALRRALFAYHEVTGLPFRHPRLNRVAERVTARQHLRAQVPDPTLRARLTPDYRIGCKRILLSDDYYPALQHPNVTLVDGALAEVRGTVLVGADGSEREADVVVLATGFYVLDLPFADLVVGTGGRRLSEIWGERPVAHLGTTVHGVPNFFLILGPNTGLGHSSVVLMAEAQIEHAVAAVAAMRARGLAAIEPTAAAQQAWADDVDRMSEGTVWLTGCDSWYLDATGRNAALWPGTVPAFQKRVGPFDPAAYHLRPAPTPVPAMSESALSEPPREDRLRGAAARVLNRLPGVVQQALAGAPPEVVDGQRLDPAVQMLLALNPREDGAPIIRHEPQRARAQMRRDILAITGRPTPVGRVEALTVAGAAGPLDARLYLPRDVARPPLVVFYHGGGFVEGDLDTHDEPCRVLCRQAGHAVLSVAYRLAPEHPFPAAVEDTVAAFRWAQTEADRLRTDPGRVAVAGDSAGGNLAAVVAQLTRDDAPPVAQLLVYPATDHPTDRPSRHLFDGYLLTDDARAAFFEVYLAGADGATPRASPLRGDLAGLAPAFVLTAGFDVLRDEGEAYAHALQAAGTPVALYRQADQPHGFLNLTSVSRSASRGWTAAARRWRRFVEDHG